MDDPMDKIQKAVDTGMGLKKAYQECLETNTESACKVEVVAALHKAEIIAIDNYTAAIDIMPEQTEMFTEIRGDEIDHKNLLNPFRLFHIQKTPSHLLGGRAAQTQIDIEIQKSRKRGYYG